MLENDGKEDGRVQSFAYDYKCFAVYATTNSARHATHPKQMHTLSLSQVAHSQISWGLNFTTPVRWWKYPCLKFQMKSCQKPQYHVSAFIKARFWRPHVNSLAVQQPAVSSTLYSPVYDSMLTGLVNLTYVVPVSMAYFRRVDIPLGTLKAALNMSTIRVTGRRRYAAVEGLAVCFNTTIATGQAATDGAQHSISSSNVATFKDGRYLPSDKKSALKVLVQPAATGVNIFLISLCTATLSSSEHQGLYTILVYWQGSRCPAGCSVRGVFTQTVVHQFSIHVSPRPTTSRTRPPTTRAMIQTTTHMPLTSPRDHRSPVQTSPSSSTVSMVSTAVTSQTRAAKVTNSSAFVVVGSSTPVRTSNSSDLNSSKSHYFSNETSLSSSSSGIAISGTQVQARRGTAEGDGRTDFELYPHASDLCNCTTLPSTTPASFLARWYGLLIAVGSAILLLLLAVCVCAMCYCKRHKHCCSYWCCLGARRRASASEGNTVRRRQVSSSESTSSSLPLTDHGQQHAPSFLSVSTSASLRRCSVTSVTNTTFSTENFYVSTPGVSAPVAVHCVGESHDRDAGGGGGGGGAGVDAADVGLECSKVPQGCGSEWNHTVALPGKSPTVECSKRNSVTGRDACMCVHVGNKPDTCACRGDHGKQSGNVYMDMASITVNTLSGCTPPRNQQPTKTAASRPIPSTTSPVPRGSARRDVFCSAKANAPNDSNCFYESIDCFSINIANEVSVRVPVQSTAPSRMDKLDVSRSDGDNEYVPMANMVLVNGKLTPPVNRQECGPDQEQKRLAHNIPGTDCPGQTRVEVQGSTQDNGQPVPASAEEEFDDTADGCDGTRQSPNGASRK
ncbi:uncharacterized protein LOC135809802 isoform X2 [Sycon ciliatum]|uniref:uncharacterized protein LOC135809802 isoform X2 n=1 Tax=Sycon ciliatum TaxID=27933 RepID=UPI0031F627F2